MSLQLIAKQMEAKGRNGDSVLVHMTPGEVAGLQKLAESAGGSLTVNPETGLVEANFLKSILPTIVGVGVGMATMNPMLGAAAGAAVGGYQAKRNDQDVGMGMLMGGLGGYGGGSLGASLGAAGQSGLQQAAMTQAVEQQARDAAVRQTGAIASNIGTTTMPSGLVGAGAEGAAGELAAQQAMSAQPFMGSEAGAQQILGAAEGAGTQYNQLGFFDKAKAGFSGLETQAGRNAAMAELGGTKGAMRSGLMALSPALNAPVEQQEGPYPLMSMDLNMNKGAGQGVAAYEGTMPSYNYQGSNVYIPTFQAAQGGLATLAKGGLAEGGFVVPADVVSMVGEGNTDAGYKRIMEVLPGSSPIKGKDGGQSDTVKTSIEGKQPAAVAHGEVYVPPETVKRAGGAKKLYAMMDRVRQQATGSKQQIKPVRLESAMA